MMGAGALSIIAAWLPWVKVMGITQNGFKGSYSGNPGIIFIVMGAVILGMGAINKKWSAVIAMLFSIFVCLLGFKYYSDTTTGDAATLGATVGAGVYCMILGGLAGIAGGVMRFLVKKKTAVA